MRTLLVLAGLALLAALSGWFLNDLERDLREVRARDDRTPVTVAENFVATDMNALGERRYVLSGPHLEQYAGARGTDVLRPVAHTYENQQPIWEIRADTGWIAPGTEVVELRDNVRAERPASTGYVPVVMTGHNLRLIPDRNYAESAEPVRVTTPDAVVDAVGFHAWLDEDRIELLADVRGHYAPPAQKPDRP